MELFDVDEQTLSDLEIFESRGSAQCIFSLFNLTATTGGKNKLMEIFRAPVTETEVIADRQMLISSLEDLTLIVDINKRTMEMIGYYMDQRDNLKPFTMYRAAKEFILQRSSQAYYIKEMGVHQILDLVALLHGLCLALDIENSPKLLKELNTAVLELLQLPDIRKGVQTRPGPLKVFDLARCNYLFRKSGVKKIRHILDLVYQLDAYIAVSNAAKIYGLSYPAISSLPEREIKIEGAFHLFIEDPVTNDIEFAPAKNVCFITGSNMAGKSTLLKSVSVCIYLAHLGFPVPAKSMQFSIFKGLITTINLSDNLNQGYSHFYNEVMRVKRVAQKVSASKPMVVVFDELFRGTNVKDAYDGSLAIIRAFSKIKNSFFMISTHIVEVAHELAQNPQMNFNFMETIMEEGRPYFSYKLKKGITEERMGMWIIENEGIVEILKSKTDL